MSDLIRLPQDVGPTGAADTRGIPDLHQLQGNVDEYAAMRGRHDDYETRALGCWGLVARWPKSRPVVEALLHSNRMEDVEDAGGVLGTVGIPEELLSDVVSLIESLPDSTTRDSLVQSLPTNHPRRTPDTTPATAALTSLVHIPLRGAWEPYSGRIQFVGAPFDVVAKAFSTWVRELTASHETAMRSGSLGTLLPLLDPYWRPTKRLLVETRGRWTAVFSNGGDTYEAAVLSKRIGVRAVVTDFAVDVVREGDVRNFGNVLFELWDRGKSLRTVQVSRQPGGWEAFLLGSEQPFEQLDRYRARVKRDRFDIEMLNNYCAALGITRSDDSFYGGRALLDVERAGGERAAGGHPRYPTAAAWRADHLGTA